MGWDGDLEMRLRRWMVGYLRWRFKLVRWSDGCLLACLFDVMRCDTMWKSNGVRIAMRRLSDMRRGAVCNVDARKLILFWKGGGGYS